MALFVRSYRLWSGEAHRHKGEVTEPREISGRKDLYAVDGTGRRELGEQPCWQILLPTSSLAGDVRQPNPGKTQLASVEPELGREGWEVAGEGQAHGEGQVLGVAVHACSPRHLGLRWEERVG